MTTTSARITMAAVTEVMAAAAEVMGAEALVVATDRRDLRWSSVPMRLSLSLILAACSSSVASDESGQIAGTGGAIPPPSVSYPPGYGEGDVLCGATECGPGSSVPPAVASFLADSNLRFGLEVSSPDAPPPLVTEAEAIAIAADHLNAFGEPIFVDRGSGTVTVDRNQVTSAESVWLVVFENPAPVPYPVGPYCPDEPSGQCAWAIDAYGAAMISDQTGKVVRSASNMREVDAPQGSLGP